MKLRLYNEEDNRLEEVTAVTAFTDEGPICNTKYGDLLTEWWVVKPVDQYTGLKDKNGVEIYENDIIDVGGGQRCKVDMKVSKDISYGHGDCGFSISIDIAHGYGKGDVIKVIGNMHQTPERLNNN